MENAINASQPRYTRHFNQKHWERAQLARLSEIIKEKEAHWASVAYGFYSLRTNHPEWQWQFTGTRRHLSIGLKADLQLKKPLWVDKGFVRCPLHSESCNNPKRQARAIVLWLTYGCSVRTKREEKTQPCTGKVTKQVKTKPESNIA